jgi:hypothetical protein
LEGSPQPSIFSTASTIDSQVYSEYTAENCSLAVRQWSRNIDRIKLAAIEPIYILILNGYQYLIFIISYTRTKTWLSHRITQRYAELFNLGIILKGHSPPPWLDQRVAVEFWIIFIQSFCGAPVESRNCFHKTAIWYIPLDPAIKSQDDH